VITFICTDNQRVFQHFPILNVEPGLFCQDHGIVEQKMSLSIPAISLSSLSTGTWK
jgi:hypothetical protein